MARYLRAIPWISGTTVKGGPDNCKSVSDLNQTYMVDTPMDLNQKNGEAKPRPLKWAELGRVKVWSLDDFTVNRRYKENFFIKGFRKI